MPTYDYRCSDCGEEFHMFQHMSDEPVSSCRFCDGGVRRVIGPRMVMSDMAPYESIVTGEQVHGRRAHRDHLARHDLIEVGDQKPGWMKTYRESEFEQKLDWYRKKGVKPPENLRQIVDGETK